MAKLDEVLTQLSDLDPEKDYTLEVSDTNISVKEVREDSQTGSEELDSLKGENQKLAAQIESLKKTNQALLLKTPVEETKSFEEIVYDLCGKRGRRNGEAGSESDLYSGK